MRLRGFFPLALVLASAPAIEGQTGDFRLELLTCAHIAVRGERLEPSPVDPTHLRFIAVRSRYASLDVVMLDALLVEVVQDSASASYRLKLTEGAIRRDGWGPGPDYNLLPGTFPFTRRAAKAVRDQCDPGS